MLIIEGKEYEGIFRKPIKKRVYFRKPKWGTVTGLRWRIRDYGRKFRIILLYVRWKRLLTKEELTNLIKKWKYDIDRAWERVFSELIYYLKRKGISEKDLNRIKRIWRK